MSPVRPPGPCLYPGEAKCGTYHAYTNGGCRAEDCRKAQRDHRRAYRGHVPGDTELVETRPTNMTGLRVIDRFADHPARGRWRDLVAKIREDA